MSKKRIIEITIAGYTFSLKNLKVHNDMSDETTCYSADLYCNGKQIARCNNDGHGDETNVYIVGACDYKSAVEIGAPLVAIKDFRDEEYEKLMNARRLQFGLKDPEPWIQLWTDEHLCDTLMEKQSAWDDAVKQLKKFAKNHHPDMQIWFNGETMVACTGTTFGSTDGTRYENVTEYVR